MTGEEMDDVVVLTDEDGAEHEFTVVDVIEVGDKEYAILLPMDQEPDEEDEEEAVILRVEHEDGEDVLVEIDDDDEWERVAEAWEEIVDEEQA